MVGVVVALAVLYRVCLMMEMERDIIHSRAGNLDVESSVRVSKSLDWPMVEAAEVQMKQQLLLR